MILLSPSEDFILPPLENTLQKLVFVFFVFILLFKTVFDSTKNQNHPQNRRKKHAQLHTC